MILSNGGKKVKLRLLHRNQKYCRRHAQVLSPEYTIKRRTAVVPKKTEYQT